MNLSSYVYPNSRKNFGWKWKTPAQDFRRTLMLRPTLILDWNWFRALSQTISGAISSSAKANALRRQMAEEAGAKTHSVSPEASLSTDAGTVSLTGKRIVIVEDEGITQLQLRRTLLRAGLNVVGMANNGRSAVSLVLAERPDLVLMDIRMPIMDGIEAAQLILAEYPVCIVMLTAFATEEYTQKAKEAGACGYIHKPVSSETLLPLLERTFREYKAAEATKPKE